MQPAVANALWTVTTSNSGAFCFAIRNWLAWEMLWTDSLRETYDAIYKTVKAAKPDVPVGWHIWHNNSFNPIYRAEQDLRELSQYSDFLKIVMYNNCGGERMALYVDNIGSTLYGDLSKQSLLDFNYARHEFQRTQLRPDSLHRALGRLRLPRDQTRDRRRSGNEYADLARHRYRHPHRSQSQQADPAGGQGGRVGRISRRGRLACCSPANTPKCGLPISAVPETP